MSWGDRVVTGAARLALGVLRALGPVRASDLGGWVARGVGPLLPVSRVADCNLRLAMPGLERAARRRIVRAVWDNLGRTVGELPHLRVLEESAEGPGWVVEGLERIGAVARGEGPAILFGGHFSNWELMPVAAVRVGLDFGLFYRAADNAGIDALVRGLRGEAAGGRVRFFAKGAGGARQGMQHLARGGVVGMLVDQKMNDGVEARLFGRAAMTASAAAALALRLRCPLIPVHVRRVGAARFRVICEAPLAVPQTGDRRRDVLALTQAMNDRLEGWIRESPGEWLWLHRRFEKSLYRRRGEAGGQPSRGKAWWGRA